MLVAAGAALALLTGGVAYAATADTRATCTPDPVVTVGASDQSFDVHCSVPLPPAVTVTDTATVTVTASPSPSSTTPTSSTTSSSSTTTPPPTTTTTAPSSAFPGPDNTGVPDGTVLTTYTGPMTITVPNTVIDSKLVTGDMEIEARGVKITRSKFVNGSVQNRKVEESDFTIADSTIEVGNRQQRGLWGEEFTATRVDVSGGYSGGWCHTCTVQDSWFHDLDYQSGWHVSAFRMDFNTTLRHNTLSCDLPVYPDGGCSADMTGYGDFHAVYNNLIENNLFVGNAGASYCAYGGGTTGKPYSGQDHDIRFIDNVFQRGVTGKCGRYGPIASFDTTKPGNVWSGNTWDDGTALNR